MRILAIVDDQNTCECCGKHPISRAAAVELDCGSVVYYGMVCATKKHFNKSESELKKEIAAARAAEVERIKQFLAPRHELKELKSAFAVARAQYRFGPEFAAHVRPYREKVSALVAQTLGTNVYGIRESEVT